MHSARRLLSFFALVTVLLGLTGCTGILGDFTLDGGLPEEDANVGLDASLPPGKDGSVPPVDSTVPPADGNTGPDSTSDTNVPPVDTGTDAPISCPPGKKACGSACVS